MKAKLTLICHLLVRILKKKRETRSYKPCIDSYRAEECEPLCSIGCGWFPQRGCGPSNAILTPTSPHPWQKARQAVCPVSHATARKDVAYPIISCLKRFLIGSIRFHCFFKLGEHEAEPVVVVTVVGRGVVAIRRAAVPRVVVPTTAAEHAVRATLGYHRMTARQDFRKSRLTACWVKASKGRRWSA